MWYSRSVVKTCSLCKIAKNLDCFNKHRGCKDGLQPRCKDCWAAWRATGRAKSYIKQYAKDHPDSKKKAANKYSRSEKGSSKKRSYAQTPKAIAAKAEYFGNPAVKAAISAYRKLPEVHQRSWARTLWSRYKITAADYFRMLDAQNGCCKICLRADPGQSKHRRFHVDHDHKTMHVRGLLCATCNFMLGAARDSERVLIAGVSYLADARKAYASKSHENRLIEVASEDLLAG